MGKMHICWSIGVLVLIPLFPVFITLGVRISEWIDRDRLEPMNEE